MMIWVPYANLAMCAHCFDDRDLFEQQYRVMYLLQILGNQHKISPNWQRSYDAWSSYPRALLHYLHTMILEWDRRDYPALFDIIRTPEVAEENGVPESALGNWYDPPGWLGWEEMHSSHRAFMRYHSMTYRYRWDDEKTDLLILRPGRRIPAGEFIVRDPKTKKEKVAMVIQQHRWQCEILMNGQYSMISYQQIERKEWLPDYMPMYERFRQVFP